MLKDLKAQLKNLEDKINNLKPSTGGGVEAEELENLQNQIDNLRKEFE
jgi:flagellar biosynthesis chaperone FliJ